MKFIITENKLDNTIQKMIDKSILEIRNIDDKDDLDTIPDWLSFDSVNIISYVDSIKINRIEKSGWIRVYVDVYLNTPHSFDITQLLYDIKNYINNTFGIGLSLVENSVSDKKNTSEW